MVQFQYGDTPVYPHLFFSDSSKMCMNHRCQGRNSPVQCIWRNELSVSEGIDKFTLKYPSIQVHVKVHHICEKAVRNPTSGKGNLAKSIDSYHHNRNLTY